ncbi:hypothetical protein, partial [Burkholderia thailandensis]|uniref:hypothetical protein n=1 Tax=Burkholderia thailandensis TaxID=57975 RepID=UPI0021658EC7
RCRLSLGGKQLISSPFCSASDSPPPSTETFNRPQHTKFLTRPIPRDREGTFDPVLIAKGERRFLNSFSQ